MGEKYEAGEGNWKKISQKQTKEDEIGSFPEKELRIMTVKTTKILKAK